MLEKMGEFFDARIEGYEAHQLNSIDAAAEFYPFTAGQLPREPGACVRVSLGLLCALLLICSAFAGRVMTYLTTLAGGVVS